MFQIQDPAANLRLSAEDLNFRARILISARGFEPGLDIRGHKGQDSTGTRCRGFFILESWCRSFLSSEKIPWNHDVVAYLSPFLDVVVFWSWNLDVVVYVPPRPRFRYHRENRKITHNYVYVVEKYFSCPNLCNIYLHNICISDYDNK